MTTSIAIVLSAKEKGLLDRVGLGSLEDIPWEAFPLALGLSALIGAAAGLIYGGLLGSKRGRREKKS